MRAAALVRSPWRTLVLLATRVFRFRAPGSGGRGHTGRGRLVQPTAAAGGCNGAVDRCFNRARYDAEQTVAAFAARLKEALDLDSVLEDLARVVQRTLESAHVSVLNVTGEHDSLGSERGLATPSPDGKGRETSRPPNDDHAA